MPTYKTPDVYVEEISTLPRSVAEVETAIPAFIGYTEKAVYKDEDLTEKPTKIKSLVEYQEKFGYGPLVEIASLKLDASNEFKSVEFNNNYLLYDCLQLFFRNGGGKCYIISVGSYDDEIDNADISKGLDALKKEDEPTMILFPDATLLESQLHDLQAAALAQCAKLGDRVAVMDLIESDVTDWQTGVDTFRTRVGVNNLKYGAAYTPYLKCSLSRYVTYRSLRNNVKILRDTAEDSVQTTFTNLESAIADVDTIAGQTFGTSEFKDMKADYASIQTDLKTEINDENLGNAQGELDNLFNYIYTSVLGTADAWAEALPGGPMNGYLEWDKDAGANITSPSIDSIQTVAQNAINNNLLGIITELNSYNQTINTFTGSTNDLFNGLAHVADWTDGGGSPDPWDTANIQPPANSIFPYPAPANNTELFANIKVMEKKASSLFFDALAAIQDIHEEAVELEGEFEEMLRDQHPNYSNVASNVGDALVTLPPSAAIAGIYAAVDESRGVWKAPANVSLTGVAKLTKLIDSEDQEDLNVDVVAGKSINAIRPFTGRGILVWGARTLAGNDNEWRYVPVRRFYNMVEESIKKSTNWAVFEPNDANLWTKLKSMIENYLTLKWRDGALTGSKPEQAFFVNVGLGITMTPQDILEGRLIVEIGMAVVRPAEFIILRFSHKMQEA